MITTATQTVWYVVSMTGPILGESCLINPWSNGSYVWEFTRTSQNPLKYFAICCLWEVSCWRNLVLQKFQAMAANVWEYTRTSQNPLNQFGMCCSWEVPFWRNLEAMAAMVESLQEDLKSHSNSSVCVVCERSFWRHLEVWQRLLKLRSKSPRIHDT